MESELKIENVFTVKDNLQVPSGWLQAPANAWYPLQLTDE